MKFAITKQACPLLNTQEFGSVFIHPLPLNAQGLLSSIEMVALPNTLLRVIEEKSEFIFQVALEGYPGHNLFTDVRFLKEVEKPNAVQKKLPPSKQVMLENLKKFEGLSYIWGGNWRRGIPELLEFYPPSCSLQTEDEKKWKLEGVDCSGLLYEISEGYTPRNTSELVHFGTSLKSEESWQELLLPLDLIVWKGHVVLVLDKQTTIESSCSRGGVVVCDLKTRLSEIKEERGASFSVRRWIEEV